MMIQIGERMIKEGALRDTGLHEVGKVRLDANFMLIALFSIMPLVDSLNGFLLRGGFSSALSVGDVYRLVVIFVLSIHFTRRMSKGLLAGVLVAATFGLIAIEIHVVMDPDVSVFADINNLVLWLFVPFLVFSLIGSVRNGSIRRRDLESVLDTLQWLAPLTVLVPYILGLGYSTYASEEGSFVGYKAFYYATNGITLMLIALFSRSVFFLLRGVTPRTLAIVALNGVALALIGTKSGIAMLAIAFLIALFCLYGSRLLRFLGRALPVMLIVFVVLGVAYGLSSDFFEPIIGRAEYFSSTVYSGDAIAFLTSGRVDRIPEHWGLITSSDLSSVLFLFGIGPTPSGMQICEMDYFDIFFQFGSIGLALLIGFLTYVLRRGVLASGRRGFYFCMSVFFLVYALVVGHVFNNAMSSMIVSLYFVLAMMGPGECEPCKMRFRLMTDFNDSNVVWHNERKKGGF